MSPEQVSILQGCVADSLEGRVPFPEIVGRLIGLGVERYHADYSRREMTYYLTNGDSAVLPIDVENPDIARDFTAAGVEAAVRQSQRGEIRYPEFIRRSAAAGCVGYFVQITGRHVHYFGRNGGLHTEWFPGARP